MVKKISFVASARFDSVADYWFTRPCMVSLKAPFTFCIGHEREGYAGDLES